MTPSRIEAWALDVVDRVIAKRPVEDVRVECKSVWLDGHAFARRLAAHANAARSSEILWVVGADEKAGTIPGVQAKDAATWWPQVQSCLEGPPPRLLDLAVPHGNVTVMALLFETDRPPYLVKNPKGGEIQYEVPWREGTSTRTARREELLRILAAQTRVPSFEVLGAWLRQHNTMSPMNVQERLMALDVEAFIEATPGAELHVPFHRCDGEAWFGSERLELHSFRLHHSAPPPISGSSLTIASDGVQLMATGPGQFTISAIVRNLPQGDAVRLVRATLRAHLVLRAVGFEAPWSIDAELSPAPGSRPNVTGEWRPKPRQ